MRPGAEVHAIVGFRNKDLVILEEEFNEACDKLVCHAPMTAPMAKRALSPTR